MDVDFVASEFEVKKNRFEHVPERIRFEGSDPKSDEKDKGKDGRCMET